MNLHEQLRKDKIVKAYRRHIQKYFNEYNVYLLTCTFQNAFENAAPLNIQNELKYFSDRLNEAAYGRPKGRMKRVEIFCYREKSHLCKVKNQYKPDHLHGILIVPKNCRERFLSKAISEVYYEAYSKARKLVQVLKFYPHLYDREADRPNRLKPHKGYKMDSLFLLNVKKSLSCSSLSSKIYDVDVRYLRTERDLMDAYDYSVKKVTDFKVDYNQDELDEFYKDSKKQKLYIDANELDFFYHV